MPIVAAAAWSKPAGAGNAAAAGLPVVVIMVGSRAIERFNPEFVAIVIAVMAAMGFGRTEMPISGRIGRFLKKNAGSIIAVVGPPVDRIAAAVVVAVTPVTIALKSSSAVFKFFGNRQNTVKMINRSYQINKISVSTPVEFEYKRKIVNQIFRKIPVSFGKCPDIPINFCFWVEYVMFLKELNLSDFSPVIELGIKIRKNMLTVAARHFVKGLAASLG